MSGGEQDFVWQGPSISSLAWLAGWPVPSGGLAHSIEINKEHLSRRRDTSSCVEHTVEVVGLPVFFALLFG